MADPMVVGDIVQVTIIGSDPAGSQVENVLHYKAENPPDPGKSYQEQLDELLTAIDIDLASSVIDVYLPALSNNCGVDRIRAQKVYPTREFYFDRVAPRNGTHAADCTATNISGVITKQSDRAGRGRSGSFHTYGVPETVYATGELQAPYSALLDALGQAIRLRQVTFGGFDVWFPGMFNPALGAGSNWSGIVGTTTQTTLRVVRRRTKRVGI